MTELLYNKLAFPPSCYLGKRVFKKLFHDNADLTVTDKKALSEDVDTVTWQYALSPDTLQVPAYHDDDRQYDEIAVIQVDLKTQKRTNRIAEVIHRAIPYPVFLVQHFDPRAPDSPPLAILSVAHKRLSQAEKGAWVAEDIRHTDWLPLHTDILSSVQTAFLDNLGLDQLPATHLYALYSALVERLIALEAACLSGAYTLKSTAELRADRRQRLAEYREIEQQLAELRRQHQQESQFNRQVELNVKMKALKDRLAVVAKSL